MNEAPLIEILHNHKQLYICGPMTGYPNFNFPAFDSAAIFLRSKGFTVVNPAELNVEQPDWHTAIRRCLKALCDCSGLILLPGWEKSSGAHLELHIAHRLLLDIYHYESLERLINEGD